MARRTRQERKQRRKERRKRIFGKIKKGYQLAYLTPFLPIMVKMLKKRGYNASRKLKDIDKTISAFYLLVMKKGKLNNYEFSNYDYMNPENPLHPLNNSGGNYEINNVEFSYNEVVGVNNAEATSDAGGGKGVSMEDITKFASSTNVVLQVANQIFDFIKKIVDKKNAGGTLDETEREISETAKETPTTETSEGGFSLSGNTGIILIGAIVVLFLVFKK